MKHKQCGHPGGRYPLYGFGRSVAFAAIPAMVVIYFVFALMSMLFGGFFQMFMLHL